jgi:hypothetical protein
VLAAIRNCKKRDRQERVLDIVTRYDRKRRQYEADHSNGAVSKNHAPALREPVAGPQLTAQYLRFLKPVRPCVVPGAAECDQSKKKRLNRICRIMFTAAEAEGFIPRDLPGTKLLFTAFAFSARRPRSLNPPG